MPILQPELYKAHPGLNQSILKLIESPWLVPINFNKRNLKGTDPEANYFSFGTFQDKLLCQDPTVWDDFVVMNVNTTGNYNSIIDKCYIAGKAMVDCKDQLLAEFDLMYPNSRWKEATKLENITKYGLDYWNQKDSIGEKTVITTEQYDIALHNYEQVYPVVSNYLHKVCLTADYQGISLKAELDHLEINHNEGYWRVVDDKTISDSPASFPRSILKYRYDFQAAFYEFLVELNKDVLGVASYTKKPAVWNVMCSDKKSFAKYYINPYDAWYSGTNPYGKLIGVKEALELYQYYTDINDFTKTKEEHETGYNSVCNNVIYAK